MAVSLQTNLCGMLNLTMFNGQNSLSDQLFCQSLLPPSVGLAPLPAWLVVALFAPFPRPVGLLVLPDKRPIRFFEETRWAGVSGRES
jgi:hypothetical protein